MSAKHPESGRRDGVWVAPAQAPAQVGRPAAVTRTAIATWEAGYELPPTTESDGPGRSDEAPVKRGHSKEPAASRGASPQKPAVVPAVAPARPTCVTRRQVVIRPVVRWRKRIARRAHVRYQRRVRIHLHVRRVRVKVPYVVRWKTRDRKGRVHRHQRIEYRWVWRREVRRHPHVKRVRAVHMRKHVKWVRVVEKRRVRTLRSCT